MDLEQINPANRVALVAWHATTVAAGAGWDLEDLVAELDDQSHGPRLVVGGIEDGRDLVVAGRLDLPDDLALATRTEVWVHPDHRGHGHGRQMQKHLEAIAHGHGRASPSS